MMGIPHGEEQGQIHDIGRFSKSDRAMERYADYALEFSIRSGIRALIAWSICITLSPARIQII